MKAHYNLIPPNKSVILSILCTTLLYITMNILLPDSINYNLLQPIDQLTIDS